MRRPRPADGFTLVEMLVVLIIIGILAGILLPALGSARTAARKGVAAADIQLLTTALRQYERDFGVFPPEGAASWAYEINVGGTLTSYTASLSSSQALVFFLSKTFRKSPSQVTAVAAAKPEHSGAQVLANIDAGPYIELKTKQKGTEGAAIVRTVFRDPFGMNQSYGYANNTDGNGVFFTHGVRVAGVCTRCGTTISADYEAHGPHNAASFDIYCAGPDGVDQCGRSGKSDDTRMTDDLNNW